MTTKVVLRKYYEEKVDKEWPWPWIEHDGVHAHHADIHLLRVLCDKEKREKVESVLPLIYEPKEIHAARDLVKYSPACVFVEWVDLKYTTAAYVEAVMKDIETGMVLANPRHVIYLDSCGHVYDVWVTNLMEAAKIARAYWIYAYYIEGVGRRGGGLLPFSEIGGRLILKEEYKVYYDDP